MSAPASFWRALEEISGHSAVPAFWRPELGPAYATFARAFLSTKPYHVDLYPCFAYCGCWHKVLPDTPVRFRPEQSPLLGERGWREGANTKSAASVSLSSSRGEGRAEEAHTNSEPSSPAQQVPTPAFTAFCLCDPPTCPPIKLTLADVTPLYLDTPKLLAALSRALGCNPKTPGLSISKTFQIGTWSDDAVPVALTIQPDEFNLRRVISELHTKLQRPFILFAPTSDNLDTACHELLTVSSAAFFSLAATVQLSPDGTLVPLKPPGDLFAKFTPQPKASLSENAAVQVIALLRALAPKYKFRKAPLIDVFLLYCADSLSPAEIARHCKCTKGLIFIRLRLLKQKLGCHPSQLRQYSAYFQNIADSLSDSRARSIHRKTAIYGDEDSD
jgi:hypothetical protein